MIIDANRMHFQALNSLVRSSEDPEIQIANCLGQRYIASGLCGRTITVSGTPGNALGAYLDGGTIRVLGNAQDATGDTMNDGRIFIHGSSGDATGYAMRGGRIYVEHSVGYRAGIHMKAYQDRVPVLMIGGRAGSFLGEYQAGGLIVVLDLDREPGSFSPNFCATGMHGGKIILRRETAPEGLPPQMTAREMTDADLREMEPCLEEFCAEFGRDKASILDHPFFVLEPDTKNPYKQLYTHN